MIFISAFWPAIAATKPDVWAWLGDVVYSDDRKFFSYFVPAPLADVAAKLEAQKELPGYKNFSSQVPIVGIWVRLFANLFEFLRHSTRFFPSDDHF
jgi:hypothetical protein